MKRESDNEFLLRCLQDGPHTTVEILRRSYAERGHMLTVHSRAADLRRAGHDIRCELTGPDTHGRPVYEYTLVQHPVQLELTA